MKCIYFFLLTIALSTAVKAQQGKAQLPPQRTTDPVSVQQPPKAELPVRKSESVSPNRTVTTGTGTTSMPIRKSDITSSNTASAAEKNKTAAESTKQQTPSASGVPKKAEATSSKKQ